ncbi:MAG: hypothetical protein A2048_03965 [Deltaproteobacteria bacterium GWA2_45_12]|nr:MAG: hypothetical protein A2048_03965 [Deltaproteobacteria bacterium GWA2_45_12]
MHASPNVRLGCIDCHGGNNDISRKPEIKVGSAEYKNLKAKAHPKPKFPEKWKTSANPIRPYTLTLHESKEWIRFVNPGDFRVLDQTCGQCHTEASQNSPVSIMTTSATLWGGGAYNNGVVSAKNYFLGESYDQNGQPRKLTSHPPPSLKELSRGVLAGIVPLPRWNIMQPADVMIRTFERGGKINRINPSEIGNTNLLQLDEGGKPDMKLSDRGLGTQLLISSPVLNIHKTRLNDPHLSLMGTNDHAGDYRSSGCTSCHVVYGNDRDPDHSGTYSQYGNRGFSFSKDPTIPKDESGHPIKHQLTSSIPSSQCMVCHMHQPNAFENTYYGYQMWDYESDAPHFYPPHNQKLSESERAEALEANPEGAVTKGLWHDNEFLTRVWENNKKMKTTQFADYHGHGWNFRAVFKKDLHGNFLDKDGNKIAASDPDKFKKAVHLADIHLEKGMHCMDCHFSQDAHGDGKLYGAYADAVSIGCQDCHGGFKERAQLSKTGPAGLGDSLLNSVTPFGKKRFVWKDDQVYQRSSLDPEKEWHVPQVVDTINPGSSQYNAKAAKAKMVESSHGGLAHGEEKMMCYTCHTSWITNCFGCHLPQQANEKREMKHYEGEETRNWTSYNPQILRDETFMLAKWGPSKGGKYAPARSSSALLISSMNANREQIYFEQAPISTPGFSSQAFNPHFPHTVRKTETQDCTGCHLSKKNDNNAWMAQTLLLGTNTVNFLGRYAYVGKEDGFDAVKVTETDEPQAVIGSYLHQNAYPDNYKKHQLNKQKLTKGYHHHGGEIKCLQLRGEYLYTAGGHEGLRVYDVANVDNKGFSEKTVTAPVSPLGQRTYVNTKNATCVALPTNMPVDPTRKVIPENKEQGPMAAIYHYAFISDAEEGLIVVNVDTLVDGEPRNNFLKKDLVLNPNHILDGANYLTVAGNILYITTPKGLVMVDAKDPLNPLVIATLEKGLISPHLVAIQFRYAFVGDTEGLKVVDITHPEKPFLVSGAFVGLENINDLYVARTFAYAAIGPQGLALIDVTNPTKPKIHQVFNAGGKISDAHGVRVAATNASFFAYVADGINGLHVIQLTSPEQYGYYGFSPIPKPKLIATFKTPKPALSLSKGMDRDRAVDESGNQVSVFGRLGSRPLTLEEMKRLYKKKDGKIYTVGD